MSDARGKPVQPPHVPSTALAAIMRHQRDPKPDERCPEPGCANAPHTVIKAHGDRPEVLVPCRSCYVESSRPRWAQQTDQRGWKPASPPPPLNLLRFRRGFEKLCGRVRRRPSEDLVTGYFHELNMVVTPQQMEDGLSYAFSHARALPTPAELKAMCLGNYRADRRGA